MTNNTLSGDVPAFNFTRMIDLHGFCALGGSGNVYCAPLPPGAEKCDNVWGPTTTKTCRVSSRGRAAIERTDTGAPAPAPAPSPTAGARAACPKLTMAWVPPYTQVNRTSYPGSNTHGLEDGIVVRRADGGLTMLTAEPYASPYAVAMQLGVYTSRNGLVSALSCKLANPAAPSCKLANPAVGRCAVLILIPPTA